MTAGVRYLRSKFGKPRRSMSIRMEREIEERLRKYAKKHRLHMTSIIEQAVFDWLEKNDPEEQE